MIIFVKDVLTVRYEKDINSVCIYDHRYNEETDETMEALYAQFRLFKLEQAEIGEACRAVGEAVLMRIPSILNVLFPIQDDES
ncbi:MAG: hypothetical protein IPK79_13110 [Vampirovibrionales bacterium]|nr:hypothetical protein [Vampirovibrionales bacterium]